MICFIKSQLEISSILNFHPFTWKYSLVFKIMLEKLTKKTPSVFCIFIKVNIHENIQSYLYIHFNAISPNLHLKTVFMFSIVFSQKLTVLLSRLFDILLLFERGNARIKT